MYPIVTILDFHSANKPRFITSVLLTGCWPVVFAVLRFDLIVRHLDGVTNSPQSMTALASELEMAFLLTAVHLPALRVLRRKLVETPAAHELARLWDEYRPRKKVIQEYELQPRTRPENVARARAAANCNSTGSEPPRKGNRSAP